MVHTEIIALLLAVGAASATMLGWAIAVSRREWRPRTSGWLLLVSAAAMMLVSAFELLPGAAGAGLAVASIGAWAAAGAGVVVVMHVAAHRLEFGVAGLQRSGLIIAVAIGLHNIPEGAAPYAAALLSLQGGLITAAALGVHNIAEGLVIAAPVVVGGGTKRRAFWLTLVATLGEIGGAVIAFTMTAGIDNTVAGGLLAFVAGVMVAVSLLELLPAALRLLRAQPADEPAGDLVSR